MRAYAHERFSRRVTLTRESVGDYAHAVGDTNPVHHDAEFAAATRFGRPIASGTHTTALLLALTASHYSQRGAMLGLEFWVRFRKADGAEPHAWMPPNVKALQGVVGSTRAGVKPADPHAAFKLYTQDLLAREPAVLRDLLAIKPLGAGRRGPFLQVGRRA